MVWLTRNSASARHAASADQSNALLQRPLPTKLRITVATVYIQRYSKIHWRQSCPGKAAAGGCPFVPGSGARPQPVPAPARGAGAVQPMLMAPAEAYREARSTRQSPKAKIKAVKDFEAWSPKFPPNLNRSPKRLSRTKASVEARSANRPKCASKLEALVEVGILDFDANVDCKCQEHNSISKELSRGSYLICKIEYSRRIFGLSWFLLRGLLEKSVD